MPTPPHLITLDKIGKLRKCIRRNPAGNKHKLTYTIYKREMKIGKVSCT